MLLRLAGSRAQPGDILTLRALRHDPEWQLRFGWPSRLHAPASPAHDAAADVNAGGIELLTAQQVAEAHGGQVWFDPATGGGATVWLSIRDLHNGDAEQ